VREKVQEVILSTPYAMRNYFARTDGASSTRPGLVAQNEQP
jgi:hypothetical protein